MENNSHFNRTLIDADALSAQNHHMANPKRAKLVKRKAPKKRAHKAHAVYSLARKKKRKPDFQYANGEHPNGMNNSLHKDALPYRSEFTAVLDVAPPRTLEIEIPDAEETLPPETSEALGHIERLNLKLKHGGPTNCMLIIR